MDLQLWFVVDSEGNIDGPHHPVHDRCSSMHTHQAPYSIGYLRITSGSGPGGENGHEGGKLERQNSGTTKLTRNVSGEVYF